MTKCPICKSKKGKRSCLIVEDPICSTCCGNSRKEELCSECKYYQKPRRNYKDVPAYKVSDMDGNIKLEAIGNVIEGALVAYDEATENRLNDDNAIKIIELLIDCYHFGDQQFDTDNELILNGVCFVDDAIKKDLIDIDKDVLVKILGVIRFVAKRRTKLGREYMSIIHEYVGQRIDTGIRLIKQQL
jgi:hypothetical protein